MVKSMGSQNQRIDDCCNELMRLIAQDQKIRSNITASVRKCVLDSVIARQIGTTKQ